MIFKRNEMSQTYEEAGLFPQPAARRARLETFPLHRLLVLHSLIFPLMNTAAWGGDAVQRQTNLRLTVAAQAAVRNQSVDVQWGYFSAKNQRPPLFGGTMTQQLFYHLESGCSGGGGTSGRTFLLL